MPVVLKNSTYFDGREFLTNRDITFSNGTIAEIKTSLEPIAGNEILVPGFIDLQIYGAGGQLFSADPTVDSLKIIEKELLAQGTTGFLICLATNTPEVFKAAIQTMKDYMPFATNCLGLHLEGPFLNPNKRGAHIENLIRKASLDEIKELVDFAEGTIKMMTIAPETQEESVVDYLLNNGVVVSLGHSDASFEQATAAYNQGVQSTTHLFNAMSPIHHRNPGIPTAVFNHNKAMASIIVDGFHVDFEVVKISQLLLKERLFLITDAVTTCSRGSYQHRLTNGKYVMPDGTLSGSALTMPAAVKNCVDHCGISLDDAVNMATRYPAKLMGIDHIVGEIKVGAKANLVELNQDLTLKGVIFNGERMT